MDKIVLITGATSGIGYFTALEFASLGCDLIITGRRKDRLDAIKKELIEKYPNINVLTLCFDVRNLKEVEENLGSLHGNWRNIDILINNAGLALGKEPIYEGDIKDWDQMIDTNIKGLLYVSRTIIPILKEKKHGHIINICSIAGKEVYKDGVVYCATKAAVDFISKGMRLDCCEHNIKVTNICPGAVETEFSMVRFKQDKQKADATYKGFTPLNGRDIAKTIIFCATVGENICISDLTITPSSQANATTFYRK
ncbi:MAG: SDR family NAD(P)-dependent oxidoreductase [Bacteroidales bacterium]|jgi:NADP-dependent 3-hydroxy acid dehydrogenase YdfG|nr:SDR family NAD(P)-dependent oxidoreductase [Bacteroidales bacterium]